MLFGWQVCPNKQIDCALRAVEGKGRGDEIYSGHEEGYWIAVYRAGSLYAFNYKGFQIRD
jgi:hypothetical protein